MASKERHNLGAKARVDEGLTNGETLIGSPLGGAKTPNLCFVGSIPTLPANFILMWCNRSSVKNG